MSLYSEHYLKHHGVKGMKWGVRRYQNKDGSLTPAGKKRMKLVNDAASKAEEFAGYANEYADNIEKSHKKFSRDRQSLRKEMFGDDTDKDIFDNFGRHKDEILDWTIDDMSTDARNYRKLGEAYTKRAEQFRNIGVDELDKSTIKAAKDFLKQNKYFTTYSSMREKVGIDT